MNALRRRPFFLFLLPLFYVLHGVRYYFGNIPAADALMVLGYYTAVSAALFGVIRMIIRSSTGAAFAALMLSGLFLYWAEIIRLISGFSGLVNYTHLPFVLLGWLLLSLATTRILMRARAEIRGRVVLLLNLFFLVNVVLESSWSAIKAVSSRPVFLDSTASAAHGRPVRASGQDVYLLLLDEYASSSSLRELYGRDNSDFDSALRHRGFAIRPEARANYQLTFFSMASLLNMEYLSAGAAAGVVRQPEEVEAYRCIRDNKVVRTFRQAGYRFYNCSPFEVAGQPKPYLYDLISTGHTILTVNNLAHVAMRDYIPYLRNRRAIHADPLFREPALYAFDRYNKATADKVCSLATQSHSVPQFIYAHFLMPHAPFYYDSGDNYLPPAIVKTSLTQRQPQLYCYNVRHANRELLRMADTILLHSKGNAIIIVLGDHGFRSHEAEARNRDALFRNLFALYFPDKDYQSVPAAPSNVNVFRLVFNKLLGTSYPLLPDSTVELRSAGGGEGRF